MEQYSGDESELSVPMEQTDFEEIIDPECIYNPNVPEASNEDTCRTYLELEDDPDLVVECIAADIEMANVNEYLDAAITSNLEQFQFNWRTECLICAETFETYQELLEHCISYHKNEFDEFTCIITDCEAILANERQLARHLILAHSGLHSLQIYSNCPHCNTRFSKFSQLNKHSCYRKLTRKAGRSNYCHICKDDFVSFKRFAFHLQFHLAKRRPKVCLICLKDFVDVDEFFVHVNYEHDPPDTMACLRCDMVFLEHRAFEKHQLSHEKKQKRFSCKICFKSYHAEHSLILHCEATHRSNKEFKCTLCEKVFVTEKHLMRHMKCHQPEADVEAYVCASCGVIGRERETLLSEHTSVVDSVCFDATIEKEFLVSAYTCWYCELDFKEKDDLRNHRDSGIHANGKYVCPLCNNEFDEYKFLRSHVKSHRNYKLWLSSFPLKRLYMCDADNCEETFAEWSALQRHKVRHHKPNTCTLCNLSLPTEAEFESHIENCKETPKHICQFCEKEYPTKMSLAVHVAKSHNHKNAVCPTCNTSHKDEAALQAHIENMHVPIPCRLCHKVVKNKSYMEIHLRSVHKSGHRFFCNVCSKGFLHRCQRDQHERHVHTDAVHKCTECDFSTSYPKSLQLHMQKHNNSCSLQCLLCGRKFNRKPALKLHMKRHLGDRQFVCSDRIADGCDAAFISHYLLNQHIKVKHSQMQNTQKPKERNAKDTAAKRAVRQRKRAAALFMSQEQTELAADIYTGICYGAHLDEDVDVDVDGDDDCAAPLMPNRLYDSGVDNEFSNMDDMSTEANDDCMLLVVDDAAMPLVQDPSAEIVIVDDAQQLQLIKIDEFNAQ